MTNTTFQADLTKRIISYVKLARKDGVTAMSRDNLFQCVRAPSESLEGAPRGTNARYFYSRMFSEICQCKEIAKFILE